MHYLLLLLFITSLHAHKHEKEGDDLDIPQMNITNHVLNLPTDSFSYVATTGYCPILDEEGDPIAKLFFISYTKPDEENRPLTFIFPGGPGGAGTVEAICTFGPRRLLTADEGRSIHPPYKFIDNPETILAYTDLVFVDPVGCGFSRASKDANMNYFYSVEGDIQTLGEFVHSYIDISHRWNSPVYLSGMSYGTLRCCGLASNLLQYGIFVKGLILSGCAFEFPTQQSQRDKLLPDCLLIPTFAATAWYHGRLWPEKHLSEVIDYARRFAYDEYAPAMLQPFRLSRLERETFDQNLAFLIGLPVDVVKKYNSRIDETIYKTEFFSAERKILGGLDSRYSGDVSSIDPKYADDPSYNDSHGYISALNSYLQKELNTHFRFIPYIPFSDAIRRWNFSTYDSWGEPSFLQRIRRLLTFNPQMKIFVGSGYYDCRTPFAATEYCFEHLDLPTSYLENLQFEYYEAGHGFIFDHASLRKWKQDLTKFYTGRDSKIEICQGDTPILSQEQPAPKEINLESLSMQEDLKSGGCPTQAESIVETRAVYGH
jgi:carboxypeptidase C (cathepsin A)